jgi:hypothetical protein
MIYINVNDPAGSFVKLQEIPVRLTNRKRNDQSSQPSYY